MPDPLFIICSKCCTVYWELVITNNKEIKLLCEKCNKPSGDLIKIIPKKLFPIDMLSEGATEENSNAIHTRCCRAHWKINVYENGHAELACVSCGVSEDDLEVEIDFPGRKIRCHNCGKEDD